MKFIQNNKTLKLLALAIAIVLCLYVGVEKNPISQHTYDVPIAIENLSADKVATLSKNTVSIKVMGRQSRFDTINAQDFKVYVDLQDAKLGEHSYKLEVSLPNEVYFPKLESKNVDIYVDQREGDSMPVDIVRTGILPEGISINEMYVDPETVFVSGNKEALNRLAKVGVELEQSDLFADSKEKVNVHFYDYEGNEIRSSDLKAYPEKVTLKVDISENDIQKVVPIQADLVGKSAPGVVVDSVTVEPEVVTIYGAPDELEKIDEVKTKPIHLSRIQESKTLTVELENKMLKETTYASVTINVSSEKDTEKSVDDTIEQRYTKVIPIAVTGEAAEKVNRDVFLCEISYHMLPGYEDTGDHLNAYIQVNEAPDGTATVEVQCSSVEGLVIDSMTPKTITINSIY